MGHSMIEGQRIAERFNVLLEYKHLGDLLHSGKLVIFKNPSLMHNDSFHKFLDNGAAEELLNLIDNQTSKNIPKFGTDASGKVWFDVQLTGGRGQDRRTETVRVEAEVSNGVFRLYLSNTVC